VTQRYDYTILGAGAVGSVFGGLLANAGARVQLVNRSAQTAQTVRARGLVLELDRGEVRCRPDTATPDQVKPARVVMVFTKTYQTRAALAAIAPVVTPQTVLVSLQNGLGNGQVLAAATGAKTVLHGVTMLPATLIAPGRVRVHGSHQTWIGSLTSGGQVAAQSVCDDLIRAGFDTVLCDDPTGPIWQKACFNVALNGICALTLGAPGLVAQTEGLQAEAHALADEAITVARAEGASIDAVAIHKLIDFACAEHTYHKPSMHQDIVAGRMTEIDSLNGYVADRAAVHGLDAPRNRLIRALVTARQAAPEFWAGAPVA